MSSASESRFQEDLEKHTRIKGGVYVAASDFQFDLVICIDSDNTGYIIKVYPESEGKTVNVMYVALLCYILLSY